ncbi:TIM barrel protein [Thermus sp.]|uniref:bifunctional sugar phosphate isomerase/epimerase/4-hydroxyphenylpyruvate dioxygenase family protein n=1 Tax=Thermus sp. TaxID=275 RepID=UPI00307F03DE
MEWSIATCSLGGTLEEKLVAIARAGFRAVEIFEDDLCTYRGTPRELRRLAESLGLSFVALQPIRDYEGMPPEVQRRRLDRIERTFDLMGELGITLTYVCSNTSPLAEGDPDRMAAQLWELADRAAQRGIRVGYEALSWGRHVRDWPQAWEVVQRANHPNLGLVLDSFHAFVRGNPVAELAGLPGERVFLVQLSDAPNLLMDPLALSRHHRSFPGQGDWPLGRFVEAVLASGYRGPLSLEIFNEWFRAAPPQEVAWNAMRSLKVLLDGVGWVVPPLPRALPVEEVAFVELLAEEEDACILSQLFQALGLARVGKHPALEVELYRGGEARILLNAEPEVSAAVPQELPSFRGVGFRVQRAAPILARAQALNLEVYPQGGGGLPLPALQGPGRTRIYLVEGPVEEVLGLARMGDSSEEPLRVDHFTNVMGRPELYSWLLIYKSLFDFEQEPMVEILDPYGAFYSRCVRSPKGGIRIPLNTAEGGETLATRFIRAMGGGGIQHVAFAVPDVFEVAERMRAHGLPLLEVPRSYYRVLATRFDLEPAFLERLEAHGLLYDADGRGGEFLQLYTPAFHGRFFFEALERRGGYGLFGAANTAVRLAAQVDQPWPRGRGVQMVGNIVDNMGNGG